jgi:hypothetical protein
MAYQLDEKEPTSNVSEPRRDEDDSATETVEKIVAPVRKSALCPCGSGLKYKRCCLAKGKKALRARIMEPSADDGPTRKEEVGLDDDFRLLEI